MRLFNDMCSQCQNMLKNRMRDFKSVYYKLDHWKRVAEGKYLAKDCKCIHKKV